MKAVKLYSEEIIRYLGSCKRYPDSEDASTHIKMIRKIERRSGIVALAIFAMLIVLVILHHFHPLPRWSLSYVQFLGLVDIIFLGINVFAWPVAKLRRIKSWNADASDYDAKTDAHVRSIALPLVRCDPEQLKFVDAILAERFDGINNRMSIVFGQNVIKAGVVALIFNGMTNLDKLPEQALKFGLKISPHLLIELAIYLVLFFMIVPMSLKAFASRYPFQRRVIKVALDLQQLQRIGGAGGFKPPGLDVDVDVDEEFDLDGG